MSDRFRLTLAQVNPVAGDLAGNAARIRAAWETARAAGANLVAFPEMAVTGAPLRDLVMGSAICARAAEVVEALARDCANGPALALGAPHASGTRLRDAYLICQDGSVTARIVKHGPASHAAPDERWVDEAAPISGPYRVGPLRIGSPLGEDALGEDVAEAVAESGAEILLVPNASPYHRAKHDWRLAHMVARTVETGLPLVYLNGVGGKDRVFDGASFVLNPGGALAAQLPLCEEALRHVDVIRTDTGWRAEIGVRDPLPGEWEADYRIMVAAVRAACAASGVSRAVLGLPGGTGSALVASIAVDALGPENVRCVLMPAGPADGDARDLADALGCRLDEAPIGKASRAMAEALAPLANDPGPEGMEDILPQHLRAAALLAISERGQEMPLAGIDRSDLALGSGPETVGYSPIRDLYRSRVAETCRWRNAHHRPWMKGPAGAVVPAKMIEAPEPGGPPPDDILERLLDRGESVEEIVGAGYPRAAVTQIEARLFGGGWTRFRAVSGPRLVAPAFRRGRRGGS